MKNWTPKELKAKLDETVIGQDPAKKVLSVAISNHMKRIQDDWVESVKVTSCSLDHLI